VYGVLEVSTSEWQSGRVEITQTGANMTEQRRPVVALLVTPETSASVLYGLYDVLGTVGPMWPDMTAAEVGDTLLDVRIVAATAEPLRCFGNILVEPHASLEDAGVLDAIVVCDMYTPIDTPPFGRYPAEAAWLRRRHEQGVLIASVCTGSLVLAESGLLDGRACAGHWAYADLFADAYPAVRFRSDAILETSSEADGILTAGGVTSWQDLALHLIGRLCGPEHAVRTAKVYLFGSHDDGQLPFAAMGRRLRSDDAVIRGSLAWIEEHLAETNPVTSMAGRSGLTPRTFARRFRAATGRRPMEYVHGLRIDEARRLLEAGEGTVDDVGYSVGYTDPAFFRRLFKRTTGLTPGAYRRRMAPMGRAGMDAEAEPAPAEAGPAPR
jgi:transcriptional regulator GlxA family with amidase domain